MSNHIAIEGFCDPHFNRLKNAFEQNFAGHNSTPPELGAAVAVFAGGKPVASLWAGYADSAKSKPWKEDSAVCVFSCTKAIVALCAHILVDRNQLDYDKPVSQYWPEFAQQEKSAITVRQLMSHQAGLSAIKKPLQPGKVFDWQTVTEALAGQHPLWKPGTAHGYHTLAFGHLVGELVQRVSGKSLNQFFQDEITDPLNNRFLMGFDATKTDNIADLAMPSESSSMFDICQQALAADPADFTNFAEPQMLTPPIVNSSTWRGAIMPGAGGHTSAKSLATIYASIISDKPLQGRQLITKQRIAEMTEVQSLGMDKTLAMNTCWGLGMQLPGADIEFEAGRSKTAFGHNGMWGSAGFADPEADISFAYVMNQCNESAGDFRVKSLIHAVYDCI